jgi:hypothetical protein
MYSHTGTDDKSVALSVLKEYEMEFSPVQNQGQS